MNEELRQLLQDTINPDLYQMILSNAKDKEKAFKVKIRPIMLKEEILFQETIYQGTKVFHENYKASDMITRIENMLACDFKQGEIEHTKKKAVILVSKKGKMTIRTKNEKLAANDNNDSNNSNNSNNNNNSNKNGNCDAWNGKKQKISLSHNRIKSYLLPEGIPVPFLLDLGVQRVDGTIIRSKYDKYKQINRFLEFVDDILPALPQDRRIQIVDFGCGKSYLTFAIYYYLHEVKKLDVAITGLDLKEDVIVHCNQLGQKYGYQNLQFIRGDIAEYEGLTKADMVVTLHACDTATDYALEKAIKWDAKVILSVPCCQHEVNKQIKNDTLQPALQYGLIKERMAALVTDAVRADLLKAVGYDVDILEFIDMEHTPKNILIRAVRKDKKNAKKQQEEMQKVCEMMQFLQIEPTLYRLLDK